MTARSLTGDRPISHRKPPDFSPSALQTIDLQFRVELESRIFLNQESRRTHRLNELLPWNSRNATVIEPLKPNSACSEAKKASVTSTCEPLTTVSKKNSDDVLPTIELGRCEEAGVPDLSAIAKYAASTFASMAKPTTARHKADVNLSRNVAAGELKLCE